MRVRATEAFTNNYGGVVEAVPAGHVFVGDIAQFLHDNGAPVEKVSEDTRQAVSAAALVAESSPRYADGYCNPAVPEFGDGQEPALVYTARDVALSPVGEESGTEKDSSPPVEREPLGDGSGDPEEKPKPAAKPAVKKTTPKRAPRKS